MAQCYFHDGSLATGQTPCNRAASNGPCCPSTAVCLSNGWCFGTGPQSPNTLSRPSCTDRSWQEPSCPMHCNEYYRSGNIVIYPVSQPDLSQSPNALASYCCDGQGRNNDTYCAWSTMGSNAPFALPDGQIIVDRADGRSVQATDIAPALNSPTQTVTTIATSSAQATPQSSTLQAQCQFQNAAIGAGVGVSLGVLLLVACGLLLLQTQRLRGANAQRALDLRKYDATIPTEQKHELSGTPINELDASKAA